MLKIIIPKLSSKSKKTKRLNGRCTTKQDAFIRAIVKKHHVTITDVIIHALGNTHTKFPKDE